ncbi:MAG: DMT family protein [Tatlockia sp.]
MFSTYAYTILLLVCSNAFMTFAWYAHLKNLNNKPLWIAILVSWFIAFFEYIFQVPANRMGFNSGIISLAQLKILQEVLTLLIFAPFAVLYMHQTLSWNYVWAGLCMVGAVYFMFR